MAELLTEAEFLEKKQSAKVREETLKIEEEYPKSKAKLKILEAIKSEDHKRVFSVDGQCKGEMNKTIDEKPRIQYKRTRQYHYDLVSVSDRKSNFTFIELPIPERTVNRNHADVTK